MTPSRVLQALVASDAGLTAEQARERQRQYGLNVVPKAEGETVFQLLWRQVHNPLIWVLLAAGGVAMIADWHGDGIKNGIVILAAVLINTLIGFIQEYKASKAIESLSSMVPENATALRDGRRVTLPVIELVPGDVVLLSSGDKVPADLRLIASRSLQIEEAALTGESVPSDKSIDSVEPAAPLGERSSMAFSGTLVTYGTGSGVVVGSGANTELGNISRMLRETTDLQTPLTKALAGVGKFLAIGIVVVAVLMLITGTIRTEIATGKGLVTSFRETLIFAIALAVGAIPEGLPAIVTIALAIGVQRMARRRAIIRKLPAVETLGSTTVICTDKTGTLTRNEMTVQALWTPTSGRMDVDGVGYEPKGQLLKDGQRVSEVPSDVRNLLFAGLLCNDATLENKSGRWTITGDPTEAALVVAAEKLGFLTESERKRNARIDAIPFESENQFMATLHATDRAPTIMLKGAPEVILRRCNFEDHALVMKQVEAMASQGMRVLALAWKSSEKSNSVEMEDVQDGFELLGLQGMIDPPRQEAIEAIRRCHAAGITVKMITGDHKATAHAIGTELRITDADHLVVTGAELAQLDETALRKVVRDSNVFARVAPEHKLRLVRALQADNQIVAMTGDGVNDAPALKQSNIGVAMGITGTSVARESSDIILTDDNFASIAAAVEEGRRVYDNLVKSLAFLLPTNLGLAMIFVCAVALFPFDAVRGDLLVPMLPAQLLWINLVASVALALPLAFEAKEPNVMTRPPRDPGEPIFSSFIVKRTFVAATLMTIAAIGLFLYEYHISGRGVDALSRAQTMAVTTVCMFQIFYMLNCRSLKNSILHIGVFSNPMVFAGIGVLLALQVLFIYAPFMQSVFGTNPLGFTDLGLSVLAGMIILPIMSIEKFVRKRQDQRALAA